MDKIDQRVVVEFEFPVYFTEDLFRTGNPVFVDAVTRLEKSKRHRLLFVIDENVASAHPRLAEAIVSYCAAYDSQLEIAGEIVLVPGGEPVKQDMTHVTRLVEQVNDRGIDRHSFMVIIGGGAVLDMAGFAAAISHRSVRTIRVPTTVLSQDDSGVGVKNGVNLFGKKNFVGSFHPPFAVLNDILFLDTLEPRDRIAGVAEAIKVGLIRDAEFFRFIESNAARIVASNREVMAELIRRSAALHMAHIGTSGDPFELGSARPLDFGHWLAHKMESVTQNRLRHGEAVALGMALDTVYSLKCGHLSERSAERIISLLEKIGFTLWDDDLLVRDSAGTRVVLAGIQEFREHLGGQLNITLLREIGAGFEVHEMDEARLLDSMQWLQNRHVCRLASSSKLTSSAAAG